MIRLTLFSTGYCTHPEFILLRGSQRKSVPIPALVGLIQHPRLGPILFDDVRYIIISHFHADHIAGLPACNSKKPEDLFQ